MLTLKELKLEDNLDLDELIKSSNTATFFQTNEWLTIWVKHFSAKGRSSFGRGDNIKILGIFGGNELVGIAPLEIRGNIVNLLGVNPVLGGKLVSDYGDIIAINGREKEVWEALLKNFQFSIFNFQFIREDSPSFQILKSLGGNVEQIEVSPFIDLPKTWDDYLLSLDRHDRHELRRKMRKLEAEGVFKICDEGDSTQREEFLRLMVTGNEQKRDFLSEKMRNFFKDIIDTFFPKKQLSICFLKLNNEYVAGAMVFLYNNEVLLYNSGFDPDYSYLAPGLILKAYMIKQAIEEGKKRFDFLRGGERYKYDLGGKKRNLYKISFKLKA